MTSETFVQGVKVRHPSRGDNTALLKDIKDLLEQLSPSGLEALWEHYRDYYDKNYLPRRQWFREAIEKLGISYRRPKARYAYICAECGTIYPMRSNGCPECRKMTEVTVVNYLDLTDEQKRSAVRVQHSCWQCGLYSKFALGPVCKRFGKRPDDPESCKMCECRRCCQDERILKEDPEMFGKMIETGKVFDPVTASKEKKAG